MKTTSKNTTKENAQPVAKNKNAGHETDAFFAEPVDPVREGREQGLEVIRHLLIWMADAPTLEKRGLRATLALHCIRPDLIHGATLEQIGDHAGYTRQSIHKLARDFRDSMGLVQ
ncbi:hypothetical protein OH491_10355 [Termitidicoccus mucosus]|uniref:Uncharacterized protein n=1 Tax=Termitidicoccus mucosus TaxID=1184151 RepID=A0A178IHH2_9BACT|nr:hypothetical protein AW736_16990 [Opitutaceae bacterium TSB47]